MLLAGGTARGAVDVSPQDGLGDIWQLKYGAAGLEQNGDADGDGLANAQEAIAGTDPFKANSTIRISSIHLDAAGVHVAWNTVLGKRYQVQGTTSLATLDWQNEGSPVDGTDADASQLFSTASSQGKFYRVVVQDVYSAGDDLSDWERLQLGLNPKSSHNHGLTATDDMTWVKSALQSTNVVTIAASNPNASKAGLKPGTLVVTRAGNLGPLTVNYTVGGTAVPGVDYAALPGSVTLPLGVNSATIDVTPLPGSQLHSPLSVIVTLVASTAYSLGTPAVGPVVISDEALANGTGLLGRYWNEASSGTNKLSTTVAAKFSGNPVVTRVDPAVNFAWTTGTIQGTNSPAVGVNTSYYSSQWTGEVLPQYSQVYTFFFKSALAGRVWVNGQLLVNNWPPNAVANGEFSGTIALNADQRYPIIVQQYATTTGTAVLSWQSANQPKQVIPTARLFPNSPPQIISPTELTYLKNSGPVSFQVVASGNPTNFSAANLPPGWSIVATGTAAGLVTGSPTQAGVWQVPLTATNANGSGSAILTLTIVDTAGAITREVWNGAFTSIATAPFNTTPASTDLRPSLEGPQDAGDNYASRMRGYLFAPKTGAYQFWISGDDAAELWISNDEEPMNLFQRAATTGPTGYRDWTNANAGKSPLLWLKAGQRYYVEVRHLQTTGSNNVSVGWFKPGDAGTGITPTEVVPGYALSPWAAQKGVTPQRTLFTTNLTPQGASLSSGYGSAALRLSADETTAILSFNYANLTGPMTEAHVHDGSGMLPTTSNIVFDLDEPGVTILEDGSYVWPIASVAGLSAAQIVQGIKNGTTYFNIHTAAYPSGEIKGFFWLQDGAQNFTAPAAPPAWTDDHSDAKAASRFLLQSTFGASATDIAAVQSLGYPAWIDNQFTLGPTLHLPYVYANGNFTNAANATYPTTATFNAWWKNSITAPDQLRQRVAFALSEILVVSASGELANYGTAVSDYYDTLLRNAFGNFRDILKAVTLHPSMGDYLDMRANDKPNLSLGTHPNENYAREILQLFSIGLNRLFPDGSLMLNSKGLPIATYDQDTIVGFAHAFTGWTYNQANSGVYLPTNFGPARDYTNPMKEVPSRHFTGQKRILNNVVLPGLPSIGGVALDPYATHTTAQIQNAAYQALPSQELDATHDALFNHPNTGPFICRQLIQRLVTSTPSRGYIYRVVQAFNDDGSAQHVRGNMQAVIKAILLDYEARSTATASQQGFGKQREPVLRITGLARAFPAPPAVNGTYSQVDNLITVNTTAPHRLSTGNTAAIDILDGASSPGTDGNYVVTTTGSTSFTMPAPDFTLMKYSQTGTTVTLWQSNGSPHYLADRTGYVSNSVAIYLKKFTGTTTLTEGFYPIATYVDPYKFTVETATAVSGTTTGTAYEVVYRGGYHQSGSAITVTTTTTHGLANGSNVYIRFFALSGTNVTPSGNFNINVVDDTHFTVTALDTITSRDGTVAVAPHAITSARSGNLTMGALNWMLNSTNGDLQQTPLASPTVFNFFEPDYQFGGILALAGLVTPEFQLTTETNVINQANFLYNGIANPSGNTNGLSSFRSGANNVTLDFGTWMQLRPGTTAPWTNDVNIDALIDALDTLLTPRQLSSSAKASIKAHVINTANIAYSNTAPTDTQKRDRLRSLIHLIATSADYTIQK